MILGWREWVALPGCGIDAIKAKLDTGARSSAIHVRESKTFRRNGVDLVRFVADYDLKDRSHVSEVTLPVADERVVKDSGGRGELRIVVRAELRVSLRTWEIDLTLTSRADMRFRLLIGREALKPHVIVDPGRSFLAGIPASMKPSGRKRVKR